MHRVTRFAVLIIAPAAGTAGVSSAHPAAERSCGVITDSDGARIGITVRHGSVPCSTMRKTLRAYFNSSVPCSGSSCMRKRAGWTCQTAPASALPRLANCSRGQRQIAAYSTAD